MRIATAMEGVHYVLHAPQGDTYADLLFTMIERRGKRPPVTYTTFQARDLGGDTAELFKTRRARCLRALPAAGDAGRRLLHRRADPGRSGRPGRGAGPADPGRAAGAAVLPAQGKLGRGRDLLPAGAHAAPARRRRAPSTRAPAPRRARAATCSGPTALGFRHRDDVQRRSRGCSTQLGVDVNVVAPLGATPADLRPPRRGRLQRRALPGDRRHRRAAGCSAPSASRCTTTVPIGVGATRDFIAEVADAGRRRCRRRRWPTPHRALPWYSRSVDSTYLTGKRVFIFGDATHAIAAARIAQRRTGLQGGRPRHLQPRVRPRRARSRQALRRRGADHRRLPRGRGARRRAAARAGARHADGAPHRQAPGRPLRGDLGAGARAGLPGALLAADGLRRRQRASSTPGSIR